MSIFEAVADRVLEVTYVLKDSHLFPDFQDFLHWFKTIIAQALLSLVALEDRRLVQAVGKSGISFQFFFYNFFPLPQFPCARPA